MEIPRIPASEVALIVALGVAVLALLWWTSWFLVSRSARLALRTLPYGSSAFRRARPVRHWLRARWPVPYRMVADRLEPSVATGLPLTLMVLAAGYLAVLFAGMVEEVFESEDLQAFDAEIVRAIVPYREPRLVLFFDWITEFGNMSTLTAVAIVATGFLWAHGPRTFIVPLWLTVVGSQLTTWGGKFIIARPRPEFELAIEAYSPSFPSGHAAGAMAVYGVLAYVVSRDLGLRGRFEIAFWSMVLVALVAFSRVFISVHHPSDVVAGLIVGGFWILAGIALAEVQRSRAILAPPQQGEEMAADAPGLPAQDSGDTTGTGQRPEKREAARQ